MSKKEKKKLTKKQIIILIVVTIILGILSYAIATEITKSIIDHKTMAEKRENEDYHDLIEPDTINNISLETLIDNYNNLTDNKININSIIDNKIMIDNNEITFFLEDNNINIIRINFNKKNNSTKEIISNMIIASNNNITEETTDLIYDRVFETLGFTEDEESKTSEFFQYQGLELSLKEYKDNDYKYSFRIGRIIKENTDTETNQENEEE